MSFGLLIVLPVEEARDVDRLALVGLFVLVDLRLGRPASDVGHALEQGTAGARRSRRRGLVLVGGWRDRRSADRAGQDVVGAEQKLLIAVPGSRLDRGRSLGGS